MAMSNETQSNIELSSILDAYMYIDYMGEDLSGLSLQQAVSRLRKKDLDSEQTKYLDIIDAAIKSDDALDPNDRVGIGDIEILCQSNCIEGEPGMYASGAKLYGDCRDDLIQACAFQTGDGDVYVAYRGTGDGRWSDNADGYVDASTDMQEAASSFYDYVANEILTDDKGEKLDSVRNIYVTGHSKGGNEAQYVTLASDNRDLIDACYSFDGQGFSDEAIKKFEQDPNYDDTLNKMYSINGENDYVHVLANPVIPEENTYIVKNSGGFLDFASCHDIANMLTDEDDNFTSIQWLKNDENEIISGQEGWLTKAASWLNDIVLWIGEHIGAEAELALASAVMEFFEIITGDFFVNNRYLFGMEKTADLQNLILDIYKRYGFAGLTAVPIMLVWQAAYDDDFYSVDKAIDNTVEFVDSCDEFEVEDKVKFDSFASDMVLSMGHSIASFSGAQSGTSYASENPSIVINTTTMQNYATQLRSVSKRAKTLDSQMNSLYFQLGINWNTIPNLAKLLKNEVLLDYANRLDNCADYLEQTAEEFNQAEQAVLEEIS